MPRGRCVTRSIAETYAARGVVVVGVGVDGWASLGETPRHALRQAATIIGSPRQLEQLPVWLGAAREQWRSPRRGDIAALVEEHADGGVAVLASGDPLLYGIGRTLVEELGIDRLLFLPNLSSVSLACARLGWPVESVTVINASGGGLDTLPRHLAEGARLIVLSAGRDTPTTVATRLADRGFGNSELVVLGDLGAAREGRWEGTATGWDAEVTSGLNVIAVTARPGPGEPRPEVAGEEGSTDPDAMGSPGGAQADGAARPEAPEVSPGEVLRSLLAPAPGEVTLPAQDAAERLVAWAQAEAEREAGHGGASRPEPEPERQPMSEPMSEPASEPARGPDGGDRRGRVSLYGATRLAELPALVPGPVRAGPGGALLSVAVLAALDPAPGETLWEVGGSGAAALAWSAAVPGARAAVISAEPPRSEPVTPFGVAPIQRVTGRMPAAAAGLPTPDAVLLLDVSAAPAVMETTWRALRYGGRLVAAATTVDEVAVLARYHRILGGDLTRLQLAVAQASGEDTRFGAPTEVVLWVRRKTGQRPGSHLPAHR